MRAMCRAINVSASRFYKWFGKHASEHNLADVRLTRCIREDFKLSELADTAWTEPDVHRTD